MKRITFAPLLSTALLASALLAGCATAPRADASASNPNVQFTWNDPASFADTRTNQCRSRVKPGEWLGQLGRFVESRADRFIASGQALKITITDIQRAGQCEPWRGPNLDDVRVIKNVYAPSISLHFSLADADGHVVSEGDRTLRDSAFMQRDTMLNKDDPLRFEKRLLDDWMRKEFVAARH